MTKTLSTAVEDTQKIEADDRDFPMNLIVQTVAVITICSLGLGANCCALLVLLKSSIIKSTTGIYLSFLAVFDGLVLVTQLVDTCSDIPQWSDFTCKLFYMVHTPVTAISSHIVVTMTIEKCYVLVNPYKPKPKRKHALTIAIVSAIVISLIISTQAGIIFGLSPLPSDEIDTVNNVTGNPNFYAVDTEIVCAVLPNQSYYEKVIFPINVLLWRLVPSITVIVCNVTIGIFLRKQATQVAPMNATHTMNDKRITRLLIIVSLCFVLLTLPLPLYGALIPILYENIAEGFAPDNVIYQVVKICLLINHSINFLLYIMASKSFRKEAQMVFKSFFGGYL